jgi:hypothetical protein
MSTTRRILLVVPVLLAIAGCTARTPLALNAPGGEFVTGSLPATVYTGLRDEPGQGEACRGSYTGAPSSSVVLLEVQCPDGGRGIGTGLINAGKLVGGSVRMQDGRQAVVRIEDRRAER